LTEAGVDTDTLKALRGASSFTAAADGVTTANILNAADWSSVTTFQKFYFQQAKQSGDNLHSFGTADLSSVQA